MYTKLITKYSCELCSFETTSIEEARLHEAGHFGLNFEKYKKWKELDAKAKSSAHKVSFTKNETTENEFNKTTNELVQFEIENGIDIDRRPIYLV